MRPLSFHVLSGARFKLLLNIPEDRQAALDFILEARRSERRCGLPLRWVTTLRLAANFAQQEADMRDEDEKASKYEHIRHMMAAAVRDEVYLRGDIKVRS